VYDVLAKRSHKNGDKVADMHCLPDNLAGRIFYHPTDNQGFEQCLRLRLDDIRKLKSKLVPNKP
jgi:putative ATPase